MASYYFAPVANFQQLSTTGAPLTGGTITTFQAGTSTPQATYIDNAGSSPSTSLTLNTYGLPSNPVWLLGGQAYKFVIKDSLGNTIRTVDNISGINDPTAITTGRLIGVQKITATGTYTATTGTNSVIVEVQGGGGGGGGSAATGAGQLSAGVGGNSGSYAKSRITSAFSGVTVTIGAAGTAGAVGLPGGTGGPSSFGALVTAPGGVGGSCIAAIAPPAVGAPSISVTATGGSILNASSGYASAALLTNLVSALSGSGGNSPFGNGPVGTGSPGAGSAATNLGCGGAGALTGASASGNVGGAGAAGVVVVYEYS